ncbi:transposase [Listeria ivanovii]|uniref:Integrase catalytic domain-containing protein n=1 Tax=Listeria ivanovii subsp. londoniensis TaxID=202752 RepID=A0ABS1G8V7_LISIV|nr:transposase [Listeria ivanovii]EFR96561.1 putative transposase InsK for insertion sequence [Listeria ivanovii FSL F6-596]MBK1963332.1 hypothetical protein [Listeria ivanovii subsp. londoniensis]MBK1966586.1 hypothetical protein [Listeria ivanovii subsp. londoniensis]MBK1984227.1 hypothetical protein [Listeria ivanovii subsp. londoniensis]MBK1996056.1 hypothetical protein [Listeria ivanovii subsp. londoniensis]
MKLVDLTQQQFQATKPNLKWFTDVSELLFDEKKLYFSVIVDGYHNKNLSIAISTSTNSGLAFETINKA